MNTLLSDLTTPPPTIPIFVVL